MFAGILGTWNLLPNISQGVAVNDRDLACAVIINVCNRGGSNATISIAISSSSSSPTASEWIEWNTILSPKNTLERQGILVGPGKYVVVRSNRADVNAVVYGVQNGNPITVAGITQNEGTAPSWTGSSLTVYAADASTSLTMPATDAEGEALTFAVTSGTLPTGLSLSSAGLLSGTPVATGYTPGISDQTTIVDVTATDIRSNSAVQSVSIIKSWADGTSSGKAIPASASVTSVTDYTTQTTGDIWVKDLSGTPVQTKLYKTGGIAYILIAGISDNTDHGPFTGGTGNWFGNWSSTNTFGAYTTANSSGGYKSSLYHNYRYSDVMVMQGFTSGAISGDYYANSNEVAFTSSNFITAAGATNLQTFFSGPGGPNLRINGQAGRTIVPVTFLKGSAATSRGRYKAAGAQTELSANNTMDFGPQNNEGYRFSVVNALGCQAVGANVEHFTWVADITNNYSNRNFPEPAWDAGTWGINAPNNWMYWLWWAKS